MKFLQRAGVALASLFLSGMALAQTSTLPSATSQIGEVTTNQAGYATVMFALALAAVGIMVGVKWIKRARGAA